MTETVVVQTRSLPKKLKTLLRQRTDWLIERGHQPERRELAESRLTSFVRHSYTSYEEVLGDLPPVTGNTEAEIMASWFARDKVYKPIKEQATELARQLLCAAYGEDWKAHE